MATHQQKRKKYCLKNKNHSTLSFFARLGFEKFQAAIADLLFNVIHFNKV